MSVYSQNYFNKILISLLRFRYMKLYNLATLRHFTISSSYPAFRPSLSPLCDSTFPTSCVPPSLNSFCSVWFNYNCIVRSDKSSLSSKLWNWKSTFTFIPPFCCRFFAFCQLPETGEPQNHTRNSPVIQYGAAGDVTVNRSFVTGEDVVGTEQQYCSVICT
jgi:hypothetical protein